MYPRSNCIPSTTSSSVAMAWLSSTVITPSLPTLSIASAMSVPICGSWLEMAATCATSSWPLMGTASFLISSSTASTAFSMPILSCIGLAPAVTFRKPSLIMVWASRVAVVVPSPATSLVLVGAPNFFSSTTFRPLGPSVIRTEWAMMSMPRLSPCRASTSKATALAILSSSLLLLRLAVVDDGEHVLLGDDQVLDFVELELVAGVLGVEHLVADLELHRHLGAVVQDAAAPDRLDDALLGLLLDGVRDHDPALCRLLLLDRLHDYPVSQWPQVHSTPPS